MSNNIEKQIYFGSKDELEQFANSKEIFFSDCFNFEKTYSYPRDYEVNFSNLHHVHYGDIHTKFSNTINKDIMLPHIKNEKQNYITLLPGDIVVADASEDHKDLGKSVLFEDTERNVIAGLHTHFLRNNNNIIDSKYYLYFTKTNTYIREMRRLGTGISVLGISKTNLSKIKIPYESLENQLKIAAKLSQIDNLINSKNARIHQMQMEKQSFIQSHMKYKKHDGYTSFKLSQVISERNETSVKGQLEHMSLTKRGVVPKSDRYNRDALVTDDTIKKYKVTRLHDLVYNPANLKFGVIALNTYKEGIFSPIYVTYSINSNVNKLYLSTYCSTKSFLQYIRKYEEGTVYERMAVKSSDFLKATVFLPSLEIQCRFSNALSQMDNLVDKRKVLSVIAFLYEPLIADFFSYINNLLIITLK